MPRELEKQLEKEAKKKFPGDKEKQDHYIYGALQNWEKKQGHKSGRKTRRRKN